MPHRLRPARFTLVTLLLSVAATGVAAPSADGEPSACPPSEMVWAELATLLPPDRLGDKARPAAVIQIADLGASFRVTAAGRSREYKDEGRDCAHRARVAAVFVALALAPAALAEPPPAAPPLPPPPPVVAAPAPAAVVAAAPPVEAEPPLPLVRVDLGAVADAGIGEESSVAQAGLALRVAVGRGGLGLTAGTAAYIPVETTVGGIRLRQWRLPLDAGVRVRLPTGGVAPYAEAGLCVALLSERALDLEISRGESGLELGVRAAVGAYLPMGSPARVQVGPFAALVAELVPRPLAIFALPRGEVGTTPVLWIGATVGASLGVP